MAVSYFKIVTTQKMAEYSAIIAVLFHGEFHWQAFAIVLAMCLALVIFFDGLAARLLKYRNRYKSRRRRHD